MAALVVGVVLLVPNQDAGRDTGLVRSLREGDLRDALQAAAQLEKRGAAWPIEALAVRSRKLLAERNIELAAMVARHMIELRPQSPQAHMAVGRVALKGGDYEKARTALVEAKRMSGAREVFRQEHIALLEDLSYELMQREAPEELVLAASAILSPKDEPVVRSWLASTSYWLRWNSVRIMAAGNRDVDMVEIYLMDLEHGRTPSVRSLAARRLGALGDHRAIVPLRKARKDDNREVREAVRTALRALL